MKNISTFVLRLHHSFAICSLITLMFTLSLGSQTNAQAQPNPVAYLAFDAYLTVDAVSGVGAIHAHELGQWFANAYWYPWGQPRLRVELQIDNNLIYASEFFFCRVETDS